MKKGVPIGFVLFLLSAVLGISFLQGLFSSGLPRVFSSDQLEHLVNLELINNEESKKIAQNNGLVTFYGRFKPSLSEYSEERFRFVTLVDHINSLTSKRLSWLQELNSSKDSAIRSFIYCMSLDKDVNLESYLKVLDPFYDVPESFYPVAINSLIKADILTLSDIKSLLKQFELKPSYEAFAQFKKSLFKFISQVSSPVVGICNDSIRAHVLAAHDRLKESEIASSMSDILVICKDVVTHCSSVVKSLQDWQDIKRGLKLRSVRDYKIACEAIASLDQEISSAKFELNRILSSLNDVVWFFNNKILSTQSLMNQDKEDFSVWFKASSDVFNSFDSNKSSKFRVADQLRNSVLESAFRSEESPPNYMGYFLTFLPLIVIGFLIYMSFAKQIKGIGAGAMNFGRSPARLMQKGASQVTFQDIAGADEAKSELQEIVDFLKSPEPFSEIGARIPKGVLCVGPPGTGKTLIAKAVAGEAGRPFFSMSGSDFVEMFVGVGASRIRDTFDQARKHAPCIVFMDEIDAVGRHRGAGIGGGHDEREQTLNQLLVEMDGFESNEGIILMAATNRPDVLDKALLRPGRFDRRVVIDLPDIKGRFEILTLHAKKIKMGEGVDLMKIARSTSGSSGADLSNILNEAALIAVKRGSKIVCDVDLVEARDKVCFGKERRSLELDKDDRWSTAVHEAGHAIVAKFLPHCDPVEKVTIVPRGMALGATYMLPLKNRTGYRKDELKHLVAMLMGGRCAEEILLDDISSGAQNDIERATNIARRMVCEWGMSDFFGPVAFEERSESGKYLGGQSVLTSSHSDPTLNSIDKEVQKICAQGKETAFKILSEKKELLERLSKLLVEFETLDANELTDVIEGTFDEEKKRITGQTLTPPSIEVEDGNVNEVKDEESKPLS